MRGLEPPAIPYLLFDSSQERCDHNDVVRPFATRWTDTLDSSKEQDQ